MKPPILLIEVIENAQKYNSEIRMCSAMVSQETFGHHHVTSKKLFVTSASPEP